MLTLAHTGTGEVFYATQLSAGFDLCANEAAIVAAGEWLVIGTGLRIIASEPELLLTVGNAVLPCVAEIQIRPRSGLAARHGITVLNSPSTIDADYRGEIKVALINFGKEPVEVALGDRIAQGVISLAVRCRDLEVKNVERGAKGFGSTGVKAV
jgi:dUTP pyrophosphatase